ncbi:phosphatase PAP2 family protein [Pseudalkalibacillus decolorationis]|uniref:phosphatase PAP2 family protein n=1 Tax=Pseudalkalibacillus decolorationis TaxID=163879 RepID=UPI0021492215|nr:phosphatase PAP2 family protein [Pseudalkalibacillus decolorationis]
MIVLVIHFFVNRSPHLALILLFNLMGVRLMNRFLKNIYDRTRPDHTPLLDAGGFSFPSGHSMNSAAFFGFLGYLLWVYFSRSGVKKNYILYISGFLVLLIGLSRVYLGVHFPSDVIAGFAAGGVWLLLSMLLLKISAPQRQRKTR